MHATAAEARSSQLMTQLVEERGRLVDAVIEQANSSTPQLAAELARSLEVGGPREHTFQCWHVEDTFASAPTQLHGTCGRAYAMLKTPFCHKTCMP